ncbi:DUF276 domain-containing protein (plasmid) [Borrelia miyamotoi]|uniref:DUF276 domain-containing protein n=1 Tax=Borrelia miyamotoi TaxID=47466 RepID=UPI001ADD9C7D|nr:DUF276 domain-containing protein [Borrelia miyamotoi]QTL84213.1 DUF276 domain-containing protein [Borrelia miyamotoi]WAZ85861.1 DUF276 domain-containing protein [Borrelia miyamotoi]WAZ92935.1 DUF276 domain-containing protein [Borrelia miyamotoi]WAZ94227.1 DUF276 domain-containing protein [Borrelia miyamotoi]
MSIIFDPNFGVLKQNIKSIIDIKREYLMQMYNVVINDDPSSIYNMIATSLSIVEEQIINELNLFFERMQPGGEFFGSIQKHITSNSITHPGMIKALLNLDKVEFANLTSEAGKVKIYLILNESVLNPGKDQISDSTFKASLYSTLYTSIPSGTTLEGDIEIDGTNEINQHISYKVTLGKKKYVYLKVKYTIDIKNHTYLNIDKQIRDIYNRIITHNYLGMGNHFQHQDFFAPVNEIKAIKSMKIFAATKDDSSTSISDINEFSENTDISIEPSQLLVFDTTSRLIIDIES